jgi:hypothetical protein
MSFNEKSSAAVEAFNQFTTQVQSKLNSFDSSQAELIAGIPASVRDNMVKTLYVDPVLGNDNNDGLAWETAAATIEGAAAKVPVGGHGTLYLKTGTSHQMTGQVHLENRSLLIIASGYDYYTSSTYIPIVAVMTVLENNTVQSGGFRIGRRSLLRIVGCQLHTGKYTAEQAGVTKNNWQSSFLNTIGSKGTVFLEHCLVQINNGQLTHQHTGGSIGSVDLYMRNVTITVASAASLVDTTRFPYLVGQYAADAMPFFLYGVEMTKPSGVTWASLLYATMTYATTNLKD